MMELLIKLQVLRKYGGIFIDFGVFLLQRLDWVGDIVNNEHVFNKYGNWPEVVMYHKHEQFDWGVNINSGVKEAGKLSYNTDFIASTKNSKLISEWLEYILDQTKSSQQVNKEKACDLDQK